MRTVVESEARIVLSIEAAVRGGSISLLENGREMAAWCGTADVSRAEDLLANIAEMLDRTAIAKQQLNLIAVSNGPGSYTGIRIGIATALGLARSLGIDCVGVPLLFSIAEFNRRQANCVVVIPMGRSELCWQTFSESNSEEEVVTGSAEALVDFCRKLPEHELLMQHDAIDVMRQMPNFDDFINRVHDCGRDLALAVGIASRDAISDLAPNYVRNPQFKSNPV